MIANGPYRVHAANLHETEFDVRYGERGRLFNTYDTREKAEEIAEAMNYAHQCCVAQGIEETAK